MGLAVTKKITTPREVELIIGQLGRHGYEAFAVGGCVRDSLLGREPEDWDITTSAPPAAVKAIFPRTIDTGIAHGTVTVMYHKKGYEVTTYRIDGEYEDGRHPKAVNFTKSLKEDLQRRDFTINAMAYSQDTGIVDAFGGMDDLKNGIIRCVGNPLDRFQEDALRILRAIRFSAQLGFWIEEQTWEAIYAIAPNLVHVSKERIQTELTKLLLSGHPERMKEVFETGISSYVSPTFRSLDLSNIRVRPELPAVKHLRWAAFLKDAQNEEAVRVLKELKLDNDTINRVRVLNRWVYREMAADPAGVRTVMSAMEPELFDDLLTLKESLRQPGIGAIREMAAGIRERGECLTLKELAVKGNDLIAAGVKPGEEVGRRLKRLLRLVLENPRLNKKEILLDLAQKESNNAKDGESK